MYLRHGGEDYTSLTGGVIARQFRLLVIGQLLVALLLWLVAGLLTDNEQKVFIVRAVSVVLVLTNSRYMLDLLLQSTGRVKGYAAIGLVDRVSYFAAVVLLLVLGSRHYQLLIAAHLFGRLLSLACAVWLCRDLLINLSGTWADAIAQARLNISTGMSLLLAGFAGMSIIGLVRLGIEQTWDVETFGRISLILSATSAFTAFTASVGVVMYPILRRVSRGRLATTYTSLREVLVAATAVLLLVQQPLRSMLAAWLPQYAESLAYLPLLLPVFVYSSRATLLTDTLLKTIRLERRMLAINVTALLFCGLGTYVCAVLLHSLFLTVLMVPVWVGFKTIAGEIVISRSLQQPCVVSLLLETTLIIISIWAGWAAIGSWLSSAIYGVALIVYIVLRQRSIRLSFEEIRRSAVA
jgi:hypothetical protein